MNHTLLQNFVLLLVAINPVVVVPEFVLITAAYDTATKSRIAIEAVLIAAGVLLAFIAVGEIVLQTLDIELQAFQIAAGLVLLLMALRMLLLDERPVRAQPGSRTAVYPIAIPYIAGPKSIMTVLLLTDADIRTPTQDFQVAGLLVLVLVLTLGCLLAAEWAHRILRDTGIRIASRVMGLLLAALATQYILDALKEAFHVPP
ncbi:MAG TPA: MarC family protein [Stellaceae bacterium]|nr:MarC family protein [Stellaceae bacterium]